MGSMGGARCRDVDAFQHKADWSGLTRWSAADEAFNGMYRGPFCPDFYAVASVELPLMLHQHYNNAGIDREAIVADA